MMARQDAQYPQPRGRLRESARLAPLTWFRVGGVADVIFEPADLSDLQTFLSELDPDIPVLPVGFGSNLLIRDRGFRGVVLRLGRAFSGITTEGRRLRAGAGAADRTVAKAAAQAGIAGLEFLTGVPGMIGGAVRMNSGAYGCEVVETLKHLKAVDRQGQLHEINAKDLSFAYRSCSAPQDWIFVEAEFEGEAGDEQRIAERMDEIDARRAASQPIRERTGGSTFKNPEGHKAWELIDAVGGRGLQIGGAQFSELHTNFLINRGTATAQDLEDLGEIVRKRVFERFGIRLEWEIKRIGEPLEEQEQCV